MQKAIMLHTPIVSTDTFSMRTIVPDDTCGYLLPMGDVEGLRSKLTVLLADEKLRKQVAEAALANFEKSKFLEPLMRHSFTNINLELYGLKGNRNLDGNDHIHYRGVFQSDHTGAVKAGWGLVWDGDSLDTCSGILGNYLKLNSSHKLSLYLASGIPVIVWKESALTSWLTERHVALAISSLNNLESTIAGITDTEYYDMVIAARELGSQLRNGELLKEQLRNTQTGHETI